MTRMRINRFNGIYKKCNEGGNMEKYNHLPSFPRYIDLELTNYCNYKCLMCPTGVGSLKRKQGFMSQAIYHKIIEEIKAYDIGVRFIRWGEPTLHQQFYEFLKIAKDNHILCHFNTNGLLLDEAGMKRIIALEVDSVKFSFQGVDRNSYREMRNMDSFDELINKIKLLHHLRGDKMYPYIQVSTTTTYETNEQICSFQESLAPYTDLVTVGKTMLRYLDIEHSKLSTEEVERFGRLKNEESLLEKRRNVCPEVYDKLSINWDGTVSACCSDHDNCMIVGDLNERSLKEIWNSKQLDSYRKIIARDDYDSLALCKNCFEYIELTK